ncbi:MAG: ABC transporter ATP-binding protein [Lachnospiraceae bacterium]|nr:ABC transporter ATP-binding protein [Lachnospiraceae bacterium]
MLKVSHIYKSYSGREVISDLDFETEKGGIYGFLGPNGAGKSTTMNMLAGYLRPDSGDIKIGGISLLKNPLKARKLLGYLPEQPPLYQDMTVREYLEYTAELKGLRGADKKSETKRVAELADLEPVLNRLIRQISKGYKQRTGLAGAICGDPELLILDEPTSGLDPKQIVEMRGLIKKLGEKRTIILSTHILSEVSAVCDHVLILCGGKLLADSPKDELLTKYNDRQRLKLVLKGNATAAENDASKIEGVESIRTLSEDENSTVIELTATPGEDLREAVAQMCVSDGFTLLELADNRIGLEDVYLKLTQGGEEE